MSGDDALYVRDGAGFVGTVCTGGPWHGGQSGGAVLALLGHVLEDVPTLTPMSLTRLTVDIVRPVPVGRMLFVDTDILREGKKIQLVDLAIRTADDVVTTRARALRIRDRDLSGAAGLPASTTDAHPWTTIPAVDTLESVEHRPGVAEFLRLGAEMRRSDRAVDGVHTAWVRLRVPVVGGETVRATSLAALPLDIVNMIGVAHLDPAVVSSINPDVTGHVGRAPVGEWVALTGNTYYDTAVGHGVSMGVMSDVEGTFGITSTSQILDVLDVFPVTDA